MTKYINADALLKGALIRVEGNFECHGKKVPFSAIPEQTIRDWPPADVVEVRHGEWLKHGIGTHQWFCSVCEGKESARRPFCPRCGAKMDAAQNKSFVEDGKENT